MEKGLKKRWKRQPSRVSIDLSEAFAFLDVIAIMAMIVSFLLGSSGAYAQARSGIQPPGPFVESADYDTAIPSPESVINYEVAERPVRYPALIRYMRVLAESSDRVSFRI